MSKLTDRVSYLKGLADGLQLSEDKASHKMIVQILDLLGEMTDEMDRMNEAHEDLNEYVESIDDDLADLEETLFGDDEEDECHCGHCHDDEDDDDEDDEDEMIAYACPSCGHDIVFNAADVDFDEDYRCPACGEPIFPELEEDDEE